MKTFPNNVEHREAQALAELDADYRRAKRQEWFRKHEVALLASFAILFLLLKLLA